MTIPTVGLAWTTGRAAGIPVNALDAGLTGGYIVNPASSTADLMIDPTGSASLAANGTTLALPPGQTYFAIPNSTLPVSVVSSVPDHIFVSVQWK
jgi:hypothetical protein